MQGLGANGTPLTQCGVQGGGLRVTQMKPRGRLNRRLPLVEVPRDFAPDGPGRGSGSGQCLYLVPPRQSLILTDARQSKPYWTMRQRLMFDYASFVTS
ncbi:hypothetical protein R8871_05105 [Paraburkholderia graminis C4D1M]|uniref:Uncharacterized protein n=1 Tax=Paraburkholderia graminis (strain ATCC 700544 / DSM 17151 / LMG 18924 / NCIMB 13744 / C4D1M) TaxID=396598 RepID=B1G6E4_PARG4|nr:hypothetical protein BgramDRAFT_4936 [Paraburkholderia graminis C4D1M]CAB3723735.1 hypothetical protein R8871_05105 [Paraburkholderia graminis C4D1M]